MTMLEFDFEVDARGLMCPLPLLRLKKALQALEPGKVVRVLATDPAAVLDFGVFVEQAGHALLQMRQGGVQAGTLRTARQEKVGELAGLFGQRREGGRRAGLPRHIIGDQVVPGAGRGAGGCSERRR